MNRRNRRKKRMVRAGILLVLLAALLAAAFLFRANQVTVYGNTRHSSEEITQELMHSFLTENTLYLSWKYRDGDAPEDLPYLNSLKVRMKSPFEIEVTVEEKEVAGYIDKGDYVYFDGEGVVLEIRDEEDPSLPIVTGADIEEPVLYQKLPAASSAQLRTILSVIQLLKYQGLSAREIRFGENVDITVFIGGVEARLGQDEYLEEKIANLRAILDKMGDKQGTLHLESFSGKNDAMVFSASQETEGSPEAADTGTGSGDGTADGDTGSGDGTADGDTGGGDGTAGGDSGSADDAAEGGALGGDTGTAEGDGSTPAEDFNVIAMVFDSSGTLVYNVHISDGVVVDSNGNPVPGCSVNENGYVVDAYMNVIDPVTGALMN